ncbi:MAG: hypothetical protein JRF60_13755, partial [Deltaproteobacteria bacterium]|nr:hypothetical protein [Deltaproteobacteria bacterium]
KESARKKKKEQKRQRKLDKKTIKSEENPDQSQNEGENPWEICEHIYIGSARQILLKRDKVALCKRCTMELPTKELQAVSESHLRALIENMAMVVGLEHLDKKE